MPAETVYLAVQAQHFERYGNAAREEAEIVYSFYADGVFLGRTTLDASTKRALLKRLHEVTEEAGLRGWDAGGREKLISAGQHMFSLVLSEEVKRTVFGPGGPTAVSLDVQDHDLPWELLHDGVDFVAKRIALARHVIRPMRSTRYAGRRTVRVVIVGDPTDDLCEARREAQLVKSQCTKALNRLTATFDIESEVVMLCGADATKDKVLFDYLMDSSEPIDIFHYAGHARLDAQSPDRSGLVLADGDLRGYEARSLASEPLVFVNGCRAGHASGGRPTYGTVSGLASEFLAGGAACYIAPLWSINDEVARRFAEVFYSALVGGETVGCAILAAKQQAGDTDSFAYVLYGDLEERLALFSPKLAAGPYVNELGVSRIIEIEQEYPAMELLAVNELPWILWDSQDITQWTSRIPIDALRKEEVARLLTGYVENFGRRVLHQQKRFLCILNMMTLRSYLKERGPERWTSLARQLDKFYDAPYFALVLDDSGEPEIEEIELVSKSPNFPLSPTDSAYVFNKQTRFEPTTLTYNLFEDYNPQMVQHYWQRYRDLLERALSHYPKPIAIGSLTLKTCAAINKATHVRLETLAANEFKVGV